MVGVPHRPRIVCLGPIVSGLAFFVDQFPKADLGAFVNETGRYLGADAVIVSQALARWGHDVHLICNPIGDDELGRTAREVLDASGVHHDLRLRRSLITPQEVDICDAAGTRTWFVEQHWDVFNAIRDADLEPIRSADWLFLDWYAEGSTVRRALQLAREANVRVFLNVEFSRQMRDHVALLEGAAIAQTWCLADDASTQPDAIAREMLGGGATTALVTQGYRGAFAAHAGGEAMHQPAAQIKVKGTIGAGAMFSAAYLHAVLQGWQPKQRLAFAVSIATRSCETLAPEAPDFAADASQVLTNGASQA
jgi:sugar/nucleoside kinase (ribokinase family)